MAKVWSLALHGGAGPLRAQSYGEAEAHMRQALERGADMLDSGQRALDVVEIMVEALEMSGHHLAGKGSSANAAGQWELDAVIMDGERRRAGAVAALRGFKSPIRAARLVMEKSPHVLLVGKGAGRFVAPFGLERVWNPSRYYEPAVRIPAREGELTHGTVGAVARDQHGDMAAATSTGGVLNKTPGRVGDTPIIGAGTWADERVAVSCTGQGEYFMRSAVAADVSARVRYGRQSLRQATSGALDDMSLLGGDGGLIAVDVLGHVEMPFLSEGMKRGCATSDGRFEVATRR